MAYGALPVKAAGDLFTVSDYNIIKGNCEASAPGIVAAKGDIVAATGVNAIARLAIGADDSMLVADSGQASGVAWQIVPAARVFNSALIAIGAAAWTTLTFDSERYDTDASHSIIANTGRLTVPAGGGGLYHIGGNVEVDMPGLAGTDEVGLRILLNGVTVIAQYLNALDRLVDRTLPPFGCDYALTVADFVELQFYSGQGHDVLANGNYSPEFWFHWFRRA